MPNCVAVVTITGGDLGHSVLIIWRWTNVVDIVWVAFVPQAEQQGNGVLLWSGISPMV